MHAIANYILDHDDTKKVVYVTSEEFVNEIVSGVRNNREEINVDGFDKAKKYSAEELALRNYNIDLCGYPHEEEEILPPKELIQQYQEKRASLNADIDRILAQITAILGINLTEED